MWTLPNLLTLSRIAALPLLAFLLWWPNWQTGYALAFVLYVLMGITDYFDGYLARTSGAVSRLGAFLDPIADKIMVAAVILTLTAQGVLRGPYVGDMHVIAGLVILVREIAVSGLREFLGGLQVSVPVSRLAKWKTTFQLVFCITGLVWLTFSAMPDPGATGGLLRDLANPAGWLRPLSLWTAVALTLISGSNYVWGCRNLLGGK